MTFPPIDTICCASRAWFPVCSSFSASEYHPNMHMEIVLEISRSHLLTHRTPPRFRRVEPVDGAPRQRLIIEPECARIRPHVVGAVLRNIRLTQAAYDSFIDLQDKLHQNICRKRTLVAIGTHDLDTVRGPFRYRALAPADIAFVPLNQTRRMTAVELMDFYATHAQLKQYLPIVRESPVYPVIYDADDVVLSLPPIINGDHSKLRLETRNVLIECTATDLTKAIVVLDTLVCMFSQHCDEPFTVEPVDVVQPDGQTVLSYPRLAYRTERISPATANSYIGIE